MKDSLLKKGMTLHQQGQVAEATSIYNQILVTDPKQPETLHLLGLLKFQSGETDMGIQLIEQAIGVRPQFGEALFNLGLIYYRCGVVQKAIHAYTRAVRFNDTYVKAWYGLGTVMSELGMHDEAVSTFEEGLAVNPAAAELYEGLCRTHKRHGQYEKCVAAADSGLALSADDAQFYIHRSEACFALGRLKEAWANYTWRFQHPDNPNHPYSYDFPKWRGEDLSNKSILVQLEQGPGEAFLFSSMIPDIIAIAQHCIIMAPNRLQPIFQRAFPEATIVLENTEPALLPPVDVQCFLADLGQWLRPTWESFSQSKPHIVPAPDRVEAFKNAVARDNRSKLRVGIAWCSLGVVKAPQKSIPLEAWKPILSIPDIEFINLQYGDSQQEVSHLESITGLRFSAGPSVDPVSDLEGHLAQIATLDLVISTSNTTAHAAAAQGIETWVLLPTLLGDGLRWTWFCDRHDSPWYPSALLFRQSVVGDWSDPIAEVAIALAHRRAEQSDSFKLAEHLLSLAQFYQESALPRAMGLAADAALRSGSSSSNAALMSAKSKRLSETTGEVYPILNSAIADSDNDQQKADLFAERSQSLIIDGKLQEAMNDLDDANQLKPDNADILYQLAKTHRLCGQPEEAIRLIERILTVMPDNVMLQQTLGTLLTETGRIDDSIAVLDEVLAANPDDFDAMTLKGIALLTGERFSEGWPAYRARLKKPTANARYEKFPCPIWTGEPLQRANILVWTEQGVGDEILLSSLIPELSQIARNVTLLCSHRLTPLFKRSFPSVNVADRIEPLPRLACDPTIDFQMSLSDLGQALRPTADAFHSAKQGTLLRADQNTVQEFRDRYSGKSGDKPCIGISWHSTAPELGPMKSIDPALASQIIRQTDATYVSLQHAAKAEDLELLANAGEGRWIHDESVDPLIDMDRAAAQVAAMDFIVTVSGSTAHLSGGLGVPTALMLPPSSGRHWYWPRGHGSSLWYRSVKFYETVNLPRWQDTIQNVTRDIQSLGL